MDHSRPKGAHLLSKLAAPAVLVGVGMGLFAMALTQPAWLDGRIGPGLFARWLSAGVILLSVIWGLSILFNRQSETAPDSPASRASLRSGLGLLAGVALFAWIVPVSGLVAACAATAAVVSWGAGERVWTAYLVSAGLGAGAALALGLTLLPPGIRLWPVGI